MSLRLKDSSLARSSLQIDPTQSFATLLRNARTFAPQTNERMNGTNFCCDSLLAADKNEPLKASLRKPFSKQCQHSLVVRWLKRSHSSVCPFGFRPRPRLRAGESGVGRAVPLSDIEPASWTLIVVDKNRLGASSSLSAREASEHNELVSG